MQRKDTDLAHRRFKFLGEMLQAISCRCHTLGRDVGTGVQGKPKQAIVDLGFRGKDVGADNPCLEIIHRGRIKTLTKIQRRWLKRRQAIEPAIGHTKSDNRMQRCWLQGATGDALHALCCAVGYNIRWLLRAVVRLGLKGLLLRLFGLAALWQSMLKPLLAITVPAQDDSGSQGFTHGLA